MYCWWLIGPAEEYLRILELETCVPELLCGTEGRCYSTLQFE